MQVEMVEPYQPSSPRAKACELNLQVSDTELGFNGQRLMRLGHSGSTGGLQALNGAPRQTWNLPASAAAG